MNDALFDREGTILDHALEAYAAGLLRGAAAARVAEHLAHHEGDRRRLEALRAHQRSYRPPAFRRRARVSRFLVPLLLAASAAFVTLGVLGDDDDEWRFKGTRGRLVLEAWAAEPGGDVQLHDGDVVRSGMRVGFRAASTTGWLLVVGIDGTHEPYPAVGPDGEAILVDAAAEPRDLPAAIQFDATLGQERLVAIRCDRTFGLDELADELRATSRRTSAADVLPELRSDCDQVELRLAKVEP